MVLRLNKKGSAMSDFMTNEMRADRAENAMQAYRETDAPNESHYQDLITDTLHAARAQGLDLIELLRSAVGNFLDECSEENDPAPQAPLIASVHTLLMTFRSL